MQRSLLNESRTVIKNNIKHYHFILIMHIIYSTRKHKRQRQQYNRDNDTCEEDKVPLLCVLSLQLD